MLIRTVRMTFQKEKVSDFLKLFTQSKNKIRNFPGCQCLELHIDWEKDNIFSTYSVWEDEGALDNYRNSDLFKTIWSETKLLFDKHPVAISSRLVEKVDQDQI